MAVLTVIELGAGTIQGAASYAEYCEDDVPNYYNYHYQYEYGGPIVRCDFYNDDRLDNSDVDFLAVIIVTGISTFCWVSSWQYSYVANTCMYISMQVQYVTTHFFNWIKT